MMLRWAWTSSALAVLACGPTVGDPANSGGDGEGSTADGSASSDDHTGGGPGAGGPSCGDGVIDPGESCDDRGATLSCNEYCRVPGSLLQETTGPGCGGKHVRGDANGDVVVHGYGCITGTNVLSVQLTRLDARGDVLWTQAWTDPETSYASGQGLALDAAGNAFVVGTARDGNITGSEPGYAWTRKHAADGTLMWMDVHVRPDGRPSEAFDVAADGDGHALVAGATYDFAWLRKLDADGELVWALEQPLENGLPHTTHVASNEAGTIALAMNRQPADLGWVTGVTAYAGDGAAVWDVTLDHLVGGRDLPSALALASDGTLAVVGEFESPTSHENTVFVHTLTGDGATAWSWEHDTPADDCGVAIDGSGSVFALWTDAGDDGETLVLARFAPDGALAWRSTIAGPGDIGLTCGVGLDADQNPVVAATPSPSQTWVAWFAR